MIFFVTYCRVVVLRAISVYAVKSVLKYLLNYLLRQSCFCHKSLEFQASNIGADQKDGFCWQATHQESQLHNGNCMHGLCVRCLCSTEYVRQGSAIAGEFEQRSSLTSDQNSLASSHRKIIAIISYSFSNVSSLCAWSLRNKILAAPLVTAAGNYRTA